MPARPRSRGLPIGELISSAPLLAVGVLAINDHLLKHALPGWWTGKLSDFAGLFYFPLLLTAGARVLIGAGRWLGVRSVGIPPLRRWHLTLAVAATGLVFMAINLGQAAMTLWDRALSLWLPSRGTVDPSDLIALPMLGLSWLWGRRWVTEDAPGRQLGQPSRAAGGRLCTARPILGSSQRASCSSISSRTPR